jgi:hypothetical protein
VVAPGRSNGVHSVRLPYKKEHKYSSIIIIILSIIIMSFSSSRMSFATESCVPDCLVLKLVEYDSNNEIDTILYVLYDNRAENFVIRGKRNDSNVDSCDFSFVASNVIALIEFITFVIDVANKWTYILYNIDNLPKESNSITYDSLKQDARIYRELAGYNKQKYKRRDLVRCLKMLKYVSNQY